MQIGLISDIHSNYPALEAVLQQLDSKEVDRILCAGDVVGYNAYPNEVVKEIRSRGILSVLGNHDDAVIHTTPQNFRIDAKRAIDWTRRELSKPNIEFLQSLPKERQLEYSDTRIFVVHGSPLSPISEYIWENAIDQAKIDSWFNDPPDLLILGHTHKQFIRTIGNTTVINPGSVGQPRDGDPRSPFAIFDTETGQANRYRIKYDVESVANKTMEYLPRSLAERLFEGT